MVQLPPPHFPTLGHNVDSRRTSHHPIRCLVAYTSTLTFIIHTQHLTDRRGARGVEYRLLGR